ncbi:MAG TPA: PEP-CTERM sorting domain-containing protein [Terriglobia bacterium]|nr:PEP-CTERM sorting domain-containing protein [Terriglobia bacterium]
MVQSARSNLYNVLLSIVLVPAFCFLQSIGGRADTLTLLVQTGENSMTVVSCSNNSVPAASCGLTKATGSLATGTVGALAKISSAPPDFFGQTNWEAVAQAGLDYGDTVDVPSGTIMTALGSGTVIFTLSVNGTKSIASSPLCSLSSCSSALAEISIPGTESFVGSGSLNRFLPSGPSTVQIVTPVSGGSAHFSFNLIAAAVCPAFSLSQLLSGDTCTATSDFLDPVTITGASVYDATGKLIPDATIISQSGYSPPAPTPEPSSILLLGVGLLGVGGVVQRKVNRGL